jgi:hypothetical protein
MMICVVQADSSGGCLSGLGREGLEAGRLDRKLLKLPNEKAMVRHQWLMSIIQATWEVEIGRIKVQGQPWEIVCEASSPK